MNFKTFENVAISVFSKNELLKTTYSTDILSLIYFLNRYSDDVLIIIINEKDNNLLYDGNVLMFKKLIRDKLFE
jgi:hypothetical protein